MSLKTDGESRVRILKSAKPLWFDIARIGAFALVTTAALARLALDTALPFADCFGLLR